MAANCIGLDIGSSSVKVVQLQETRKGLILQNFGINPLPVNSIVDGMVMNEDAVLEAVEALFSSLRIKRRNVALAISGRSVIVKKIAMPRMNMNDLAEELSIEMVHHIPFDKDEVRVDYEVVVPQNPEGQMEVLLVAAKKDIIESYEELLSRGELDLSVMDVAAFAVQNLYERCVGINKDENLVILNIGASSTSINVVVGGVTTFIRDVSLGGDGITSEIKRALSVPLDEAEAKKREAATGLSTDKELMDVVRKVCEVMAGEFQRSIDFFLSAAPAMPKTRVVVTGGGAQMKPLVQAIEIRSKQPVYLFDGFSTGIIVDPNKFDMALLASQAATASVALGLALRRTGDK